MRRLLLLLFVCAPALAAQTPAAARASATPAANAVWAAVGLSLGVPSPYGLGSDAGLRLRRGNRSFRMGYHGAADLKATVSSNAVTFSVGVHRSTGAVHLELFAGPAYVWGEDRASGQPLSLPAQSYRTVGLVSEASVLLGLGSRLRLGVGAWANLNSQQSTTQAGPRLQIRLY